MNKTCYIYLRVSTDEQAKEGFSLENQRRACTEYAKGNGYQVVEVFLEDGKSARSTNRPEFQRLLEAIEKRPVTAIIIYKIDRFARNVADFAVTKKLIEKRGLEFISITEGNLSQSSNLIANIFAAIAEWESDENGKRTKDAMAQKYREKWWPTWAPNGYLNIDKKGRISGKSYCPEKQKMLDALKRPLDPIEQDPIKAPLVKEAFCLYATSEYSYLKLCDVMYRKGLTARTGNKIVSVSSMQTMISNSFYFGLMRWGKPIKTEQWGKHEPLINKALYDQCQYVAAKHRHFLTRERKYKYLLRGHAFCLEHDRRLTAEKHPINSKKYKTISYYHCSERGGCSGSYLEANLLEKRVANLFKRYQFSPDFIELVRQKIKAHFEDGKKNLKSKRQGVLNKRKAVEAKRDKLEGLLVEGTITRDIFKRQHTKIQGEINQFDNQLSELEAKHQIDVTLIDEVLALTRNIHQTYLDAPMHLKRHYLRFFFEGIYIKDKRIAKVVETPLFYALRRQNKVIIRGNWLPG